MLKRILVPLDTSEFTAAATCMAVMLAKQERAAVQEAVGLMGMGVVDLDQLPTGRFAAMVPRDQIIQEACATAKELVAEFRRQAESLGHPPDYIKSREVVGSPFREIIRESVFCDLIVMGEQCSFPPVNHDYETMHHLYHEASRPVVITRSEFKEVDKVVMLMDGTAAASRMMYNYVHLEPFPQAKVVLTYSRAEEQEFGLQEYFERVHAFLYSYGIEAETRPMEGDAETDIAGVVNDVGAHVLALGVHHERFLDRLRDPLSIRQNFARRLLQSMSASLFVVH